MGGANIVARLRLAQVALRGALQQAENNLSEPGTASDLSESAYPAAHLYDSTDLSLPNDKVQ